MSYLKGKIIISTGSEEKSEKITKLLKIKGANVFNFPMIKIKHAQENIKNIKKTFSELYKYNLIIFSSTNGVNYFFYWLNTLKIKADFKNTKFATIGKATENALKKHNITPFRTSDSKDSAEFAEKISKIISSKKHNILIPSGNLASNKLQNILGTKHDVTKIIIYKTDKANLLNYTLSSMIKENCYDLIIFLSPSAVFGLTDNLPPEVKKEKLRCIAIGKTTEKALKDKKITPVFKPSVPNIEIMINELETFYKNNKIKKII